MQSYDQERLQNEDMEQYQQDLSLRKMLYKYQHENEQLRNQIKALTQRLQSIIEQGKTQIKPITPLNAHTKHLFGQLNFYFKQANKLSSQIKQNKQLIDQTKEIQYTNLSNKLKQKHTQLQTFQSKLKKLKNQELYVQNLQISNSKINNQEIESQYIHQVNQIKKRIRELQKLRHVNNKNNIDRHTAMVNLETKTRKIQNEDYQTIDVGKDSMSPKKGIWGLDFTEQNYNKIKQDFEHLKRQKGILLQSIKIQNNGLRERLANLKNQYIDLSAQNNVGYSLDINPKINKSPQELTPKLKKIQTIVLPDIPVPLGNSAYQRKNDKNFVQKKIKLIEWGNKSKKVIPGFGWNDQNCKSSITGVNIWLDKVIVGVQFIHTLSQSGQHIHTEGDNKRFIPIQYRLSSGDYVQNIILVQSKTPGTNLIQGIQFRSKSGRKDSFGLKIGTQGTDKFDFGIMSPEKPIYSFGSFIIDPISRISNIISLGFAVI